MKPGPEPNTLPPTTRLVPIEAEKMLEMSENC